MEQDPRHEDELQGNRGAVPAAHGPEGAIGRGEQDAHVEELGKQEQAGLDGGRGSDWQMVRDRKDITGPTDVGQGGVREQAVDVRVEEAHELLRQAAHRRERLTPQEIDALPVSASLRPHLQLGRRIGPAPSGGDLGGRLPVGPFELRHPEVDAAIGGDEHAVMHHRLVAHRPRGENQRASRQQNREAASHLHHGRAFPQQPVGRHADGHGD